MTFARGVLSAFLRVVAWVSMLAAVLAPLVWVYHYRPDVTRASVAVYVVLPCGFVFLATAAATLRRRLLGDGAGECPNCGADGERVRPGRAGKTWCMECGTAWG